MAAATLALAACSTDKAVAPRSADAPAIGAASRSILTAPPGRGGLAYFRNDLWREIGPTKGCVPSLSGFCADSLFTPTTNDIDHIATIGRRDPSSAKYTIVYNYSDLLSFVSELGTMGIDMVSTVGSARAECTSAGPYSQTTPPDVHGHVDFWEQADVWCVDLINGTSAPSDFSYLLVNRSAGFPAPWAYTTADQPLASSYGPNTSKSFTTGTQPMLIERIGAGDWYVHLGTGSPQNSMVQVNSADANSVCVVAEWKNFGVRVRCFTRTGVSADVPFKVLQVSRGRPGGYFGYAWVDQRSLTTPYDPTVSFFTSSQGAPGAVHAQRLAVGTYSVEFVAPDNPDFPQRESVLVTPFGSNFANCAVVFSDHWAMAAGWDHYEQIECRDAQERLIDSRFNITLIN